MIEFGNPGHIAVIEQSAGVIFNHRCDICISRSEQGRLLGGVILEKYTGRGGSMQIHTAALTPHWLNVDMLWVAFDYPFTQMGVDRVFAQIREFNLHALEFNLKMGFKEVCRIDGVFPGEKCVVTEITRDTCKWLRLRPRTLKKGA